METMPSSAADPFPSISSRSADSAENPGGTTTIRLALDLQDPLLPALRAARRAMIREEFTLGLDEGDPSLLDAEFSSKGVVWEVPLGQVRRAQTKLAALVFRAETAVEAGSRFTV